MKLKPVFYASLVVLALTEAVAPRFFYDEHAHFAFEDWPAFGSIYGFFSCVAIILVSKLLGKLWLMRPDNYYES
jgi:membrane glycosyltransferase